MNVVVPVRRVLDHNGNARVKANDAVAGRADSTTGMRPGDYLFHAPSGRNVELAQRSDN